MGSTAIIKNVSTGLESPIDLTTWEKIKDRKDIKRAFVEVDRIHEPPEVAELRERLRKK